MNPRTALITGAGGGIGAETAIALARSGYAVALADIDSDAVAAVSDIITGAGGVAIPITLNVADGASRTAAIRACLEAWDGVDVLVNCAGILRDARIRDVSDEMLGRVLAVNLIGPLNLISELVPVLAKSESGGRIINVASRAWLGTFGSSAYSASKGGLVGASRSLALELGDRGITVNCVAPGFIETEMTSQLPDKIRKRTLDSIPVGRAGTPGDVADAITYLAGAGYTTGQTIVVCGGRSIGQPLAVAR